MQLPVLPYPAPVSDELPEWARWTPSAPYTIGIEEEVMLLHPGDWTLAQRGAEVLEQLPQPLLAQTSPETHRGAIELATSPHPTVAQTAREAAALRGALTTAIAPLGLRAAGAGTHAFAVWQETEVSEGSRYQLVHDSMRELARREPTFALHVQVGVADPESATELHRRLRAHLP